MFHYTLDLEKQHDREEIRRRIEAHAAVIRAAILFKSVGSAGDRDKESSDHKKCGVHI
ncbi:hypothetical protein IFM89_013120 [Coptis chinensis]|uniref:Uncharacterized protein n=1 Tax=Coptis chinensis TaxID=261450 RepID=A0A835IRU7_9MAGN|nr:hypothetical protein IFM89_013120 [Coptis chinensis]